jgi:hypothetical protein
MGAAQPRCFVLIWTIIWYWSPRFSIAITFAGSEVIHRRHFILRESFGPAYFLTSTTASFAAFASRNSTTVFAGILIGLIRQRYGTLVQFTLCLNLL